VVGVWGLITFEGVGFYLKVVYVWSASPAASTPVSPVASTAATRIAKPIGVGVILHAKRRVAAWLARVGPGGGVGRGGVAVGSAGVDSGGRAVAAHAHCAMRHVDRCD
jgi:hypothetical protein